MKRYIALVLSLWGSIIFVLVYPKVVDVREIECVSQFGPCPPALDSQMESFVGLNIKAARKKVTEYANKEGSIDRIKIVFKAPFKLLVYITEKKPGIALHLEGQDYIIVDPNGSVMGTSVSTDLPTLTISQTGFTKSQLEFASTLYYEFSRLYAIESAQLGDGDMTIKILDDASVVFPLEGDIDVLLGALRLILSQLNNDEQEIRIGLIDLRFENPVIR